LILSLMFLAPSFTVFAQVGIGTVSPRGELDLKSSTQGLVYPKVALTKTTVEAPVKNPNGSTFNLVAGTIVYNTGKTRSGSNDVYPGIYAWNGLIWQPQFYMEEYKRYAQTGGDQRTIIRQNLSNPDPNFADNVSGLSNIAFNPKYSGYYKIEVKTNYGAGKVKDFAVFDDISLATAEGAFFFKLIGDGVVIDPSLAIYDAKQGWIYTHSYASYNLTEGANYIDDDEVAHYVTVIYYKYLKYGLPYTFTLSNCINMGDEYFLNNGDTGDGSGHIGREIPCSVEFTFVGTDNPQN